MRDRRARLDDHERELPDPQGPSGGRRRRRPWFHRDRNHPRRRRGCRVRRAVCHPCRVRPAPGRTAGAQHPDRGCAVPGRPHRAGAGRFHQPLLRPHVRHARRNRARRPARPRSRRGHHVRLRHHRRQRLRRVRVRVRLGAVPWQGHRLRLDAARAAAAPPRQLQPVSGRTHRVVGQHRRRAPTPRAMVGTCDYWSWAPAVWVRQSCRLRHDGRSSSRSPWPTSTSGAPRGPPHGWAHRTWWAPAPTPPTRSISSSWHGRRRPT